MRESNYIEMETGTYSRRVDQSQAKAGLRSQAVAEQLQGQGSGPRQMRM